MVEYGWINAELYLGDLLGKSFITQAKGKVGTYICLPPGVKWASKAQCQASGCGSPFLEQPHII